MGILDGWYLTEMDDGIHHVHPIDDLREHILDEVVCWCGPRWDADGGLLVIHSSADGREINEGKLQ